MTVDNFAATPTPAAADGSADPEPPAFSIAAGGFTAEVDAYALEIPEPDSETDLSLLWFLSIVGPQTAVRAVRAALLNSPPKPAFLLRQLPESLRPKQTELFDAAKTAAPEQSRPLTDEERQLYLPRKVKLADYGSGNWRTPQTPLPDVRAYHSLMFSRKAMPDHPPDGKTNQFLLICPDAAEDVSPAERYYHYLNRRSTLPLHPDWQDWLWSSALNNEWAIPLESCGINAWLCQAADPEIHQAIQADLQNHRLPV